MKRIGISLIILGFLIPLFSFSKEKFLEAKNTLHIKKIFKSNDYYMLLEIPKLNLKREIFSKNAKENNVDKNIYLHPSSSNSNIILASHSGYGTHAYFKNLDRLNKGDEVIITSNGTKYIYEITEIEEQLKTGTLYLKENSSKMITLITCSKNNQNTQQIYYGVLKQAKNVKKMTFFFKISIFLKEIKGVRVINICRDTFFRRGVKWMKK